MGHGLGLWSRAAEYEHERTGSINVAHRAATLYRTRNCLRRPPVIHLGKVGKAFDWPVRVCRFANCNVLISGFKIKNRNGGFDITKFVLTKFSDIVELRNKIEGYTYVLFSFCHIKCHLTN